MASLDGRELAAIFAGGVLGALARVGLERAFPGGAPSWPWVTFSINLTGAFLLGFIVTQLQERQPVTTYMRPLLGTGYCGAFTTFSTVQLELLKMLDDHRYGLAAGYAAASVIGGYVAVYTATALVRRVRVIA